MNIFKIIDTFLFGVKEVQEEYNSRSKLWLYIPLIFAFAVCLIAKIAVTV